MREVLGSGRQLSLGDMMRLQQDELSLPARDLVPRLRPEILGNERVRQAAGQLSSWDFVLGRDSVAAGIYVAWQRQLQQAVTVLVHNALVYGRLPGEPARISLRANADATGTPVLDVVDRGPGIPETVAAQLFRPFFTTSGHGTGLGLYIARELCLANEASLDYVPVPAGGACFRIRLAGTRAFATG